MANGIGGTRCRAPVQPRGPSDETRPSEPGAELPQPHGDSMVSQAPRCPSGKNISNKLP